jgi:hypothetical protein
MALTMEIFYTTVGRLSVAPTKLVPRQNPKLFDANALELYLVTVAAIDTSFLFSLFSFLFSLFS